ncbi:helix-turn-helix transcriptional regulator [Agrococcus sp. HG114]|uniref:helix-turn-helix transcriptional regulator n=1 Tax=Agrococcus sp. HG114 TaxID=2969757 RepID=UPI0034D97F5A
MTIDHPPASGASFVRFDLFGHPPGVLLTERELAAAIHVSRRTLQYWRQVGRGPAYVRAGRHVRYAVRDVIEWLEQQDG